MSTSEDSAVSETSSTPGNTAPAKATQSNTAQANASQSDATHTKATQGDATPGRTQKLLRVLRRTPFTALLVLALLIVGAITGTLFSSASAQSAYESFGTGLPAFADGRWWTIFTSPFILKHPLVYLTLLPLVIGGVGWAEWRFGTLRTIGLFVAGHCVGVLGAAATLAPLAHSGWPWAEKVAASLDGGPSCGALTALVFAIATLPAPWRLRARLALGLWAAISVLYLGRIDDLEHAVAILVALAASGWIPAFRRPKSRPTQREWRLLAFTGLIAIGVIQVLDLIVPYDGPLGANDPGTSLLDVAIDVIIILLIANGIRRGYRVAWLVVLVLGTFNVLTAILALILMPVLIDEGVVTTIGEAIGLTFAPGVLWLALMILVIAARGAFRVSMRRARRSLAAQPVTRDELIGYVQRFGGGTISWMTTWEGNQRVAVNLAGAGSQSAAAVAHSDTDASATPGDTGVVAFQSWSDVAIMLGDPIVAAGREGEALAEFARVTESAGLIPCVFSAGAASAAAAPPGWRSVIVAEDTIVDLPDLKFTGKPWAAVRTAINRAGREDIEFRMVRLADEPWNVLAQVRAISEQWTGDKGLPEMRFTLGTVEEALDPESYVGLAVDAGGNLHGVTSWLPVYGPASDGEPHIVGWTLDLMRRRDGGFSPVMEFLIASSAQWFSEQGYQFVSLSGAPLVRPAEVEAGPVDQVLEQIGGLIEPLYGFKSLHKFKQKFNPRHESLYLLFRDEGDLPRIGIAITRAYLPDASLRDLVASATATTGAGPGAK